MRPTAHHVILDTPNGTGVDTGRRIGTANTSQDFPAGGVIAPEDRGVGMPIAANSPSASTFTPSTPRRSPPCARSGSTSGTRTPAKSPSRRFRGSRPVASRSRFNPVSRRRSGHTACTHRSRRPFALAVRPPARQQRPLQRRPGARCAARRDLRRLSTGKKPCCSNTTAS